MTRPLVSGLSAVSRAALVGLLIAGLITFGLAADDYLLDIGVLVGVYTILGLGLSIVIGQAGLIDLGYIAFYAIGAYWTALLSTHWGVSFWILLPTSAVLAALFGVALGYPTLRLRGDYLAIVTLGFGEIIRITLNNWRELTNGPMGIMGVPHPTIAVPGLGALDFGLKVRAYYFFVLALAAMTVFVVQRLVNSRIGLAWKAIREDELAPWASTCAAPSCSPSGSAPPLPAWPAASSPGGPASCPRRASRSPSQCWSSASSSSGAPGAWRG
jgi:branched-chain amino acid transport system permease protein